MGLSFSMVKEKISLMACVIFYISEMKHRLYKSTFQKIKLTIIFLTFVHVFIVFKSHLPPLKRT